MKRTCTIGLILGAAMLPLAGCQTPSVAVTEETDEAFALGMVGPTALEQPAFDGLFRLGAGDALGQEIFAYYVASLRAEQIYATGAAPSPEPN
jgi:hypothetical protein